MVGKQSVVTEEQVGKNQLGIQILNDHMPKNKQTFRDLNHYFYDSQVCLFGAETLDFTLEISV